MKTTLCAIIAMLTTCAFAQSAMYRCGNTYSETSCGADAKVLQAPKVKLLPVKATPLVDHPPHESVIAGNIALCEKEARAKMKDPAAALITPARRGGLTLQYDHGRTYPGVDYLLNINGKNSYGGYTGEKLWNCVFNENETVLVRLYEVGPSVR